MLTSLKEHDRTNQSFGSLIPTFAHLCIFHCPTPTYLKSFCCQKLKTVLAGGSFSQNTKSSVSRVCHFQEKVEMFGLAPKDSSQDAEAWYHTPPTTAWPNAS